MEMNLENSIKDCIAKELEKGIVEKVISEKLEGCVSSALSDMFGYSGEVRRVIEKKVKSVMIPYLEDYDYSDYIVKLDSVLVDVLKNSALENKKLLENFKVLIDTDTNIKSIKVSELFSKWCDYVSKNVDTDELEVNYDDGVSYESVDVTCEFEEDGNSRDWLKKEFGKILFECEKDEKMNVCLEIYRWDDIHKKDQWNFEYESAGNLASLRYLDEFSVFLMSLSQANVKIELDETSIDDCVQPEKEPEASFS